MFFLSLFPYLALSDVTLTIVIRIIIIKEPFY